MFNAPRPAQRYVASSPKGFGGSFVDDNPLANSVYEDPWSTAPSPTPTPTPGAQTTSSFGSVIGDATVPLSYTRAFLAVDSTNTGEVSVNALSRVLATSSLPATTIDKIVNLVSSRSRVSKLEFFVALTLVALAQTGKDVSIEQVAASASQNALPEPILELDKLQPSTSTFTTPVRMPTYSEDPWNTNPKYPTTIVTPSGAYGIPRPVETNGVPSSLSGSGLPRNWWKKQETVKVSILGHQGFILNRYMVYEVSTDRGAPVTRRYSEFAFLWDCLIRRYPFRLFPALPPKRIGPDEQFLEQRRKGLARALNFVVNHPTIKEDGLLAVFLTEQSFELWRKNNLVSLDEESASKRIDRIEEMTIPSDLEEKIAVVRGRLNPLIEQWQRICILAERIFRRREAAAVRKLSISPFRFSPTHSAFPPIPPTRYAPSLTGSTSSDNSNSIATLVGSIMGSFDATPMFSSEQQSDLARLTNTLRAVVEANERCWRGDECELSNGVRLGLEQVALHCQRHSEMSEGRTQALLTITLEALKSQRDLYLATRDLLIRHDRLSHDQVDKLKKRVETTSVKLDGIRAAQKEGWLDEAERLTTLIEKDQATIVAQLSRRVFIRACMWHELRVVLHNRENTLLTQSVHVFARDERIFVENVIRNWTSLGEAVEGMPYE
ncbi:hypothetical protein M378DRAFT_98592 [Amanita muscaria Koide BX008]|uniref:Sorting nexin MVP1 n=1 Tax=Amanita muscaria (strain Koide BX008) TaxID=946122 RepID=A0A0C2X4Q1_AMAMK|nr:hypothetical protein M378DRAFT_98592 [Amanita muscaria Koide BX008]